MGILFSYVRQFVKQISEKIQKSHAPYISIDTPKRGAGVVIFCYLEDKKGSVKWLFITHEFVAFLYKQLNEISLRSSLDSYLVGVRLGFE